MIYCTNSLFCAPETVNNVEEKELKLRTRLCKYIYIFMHFLNKIHVDTTNKTFYKHKP